MRLGFCEPALSCVTSVSLAVITCLSLVVSVQTAGFTLAGEHAAVEPAPVLNIFESDSVPVADTQIDRLVFRKFKQLHIQPVLCSDSVFVRRAYLDVIGVLPTEKEAREFILDTDAKNKRQQLIDKLLERPEFSDYWAMKWSDILRIKAEFPVNLWPEAAETYHQWVKSSIAENKPYDRFVHELLTSSGSNFRTGPVNFYRAVQDRTPAGVAGAVALTFMGTRVDTWPTKTVAGMATFFSQVGYKPTREWKEEIVFWDPLRGAAQDAGTSSNPPATAQLNSHQLEAVFPDGTRIKLPPNKDPRDVFADWLIKPNNPWFKRAIVNRIWYWLLGRGIIHEPDDIRTDNPPSNPALLKYLEKELVTARYDLKHIFRLILNSRTYQLSSIPRLTTLQAENNFANYPLRRLDAEVLIDAINKVTGTSDRYTSPIPEPFTYIPEEMPAIAIGDGSITSPFLTLFGRSARSTGIESERNNKPIAAQWLHLLNSSHIQHKLERGAALKTIIDSRQKPQAIIEELYLTILSRFPSPAELTAAQMYGDSRVRGSSVRRQAAVTKRRKDWVDIAWSLINSDEFLFRH